MNRENLLEKNRRRIASKFWSRCPRCHSESLKYDIKNRREFDFINCLDCNAKCKIDWKDRKSEIESFKLVFE